MRFSQRIGSKPIKIQLEREGMSEELRNSLWTAVHELIIKAKNNFVQLNNHSYSDLAHYCRDLWIQFFKRPIDNLPLMDGSVEERAIQKIREWYFKASWDEAFDFIEFCSGYSEGFVDVCNVFLKREMSAYRFVEGKLVEINSEEEIVEIENAIANADKYNSVKTHLKTALSLLGDKKSPDYRNSIKESISAVEALCKIIVQDEKATLGQALKKIEAQHNIPTSLKSAFDKLYGYTSGAEGIRHSLLEHSTSIEIEEARFMLVTCSAFVNYLICKI